MASGCGGTGKRWDTWIQAFRGCEGCRDCRDKREACGRGATGSVTRLYCVREKGHQPPCDFRNTMLDNPPRLYW